MYIEIGKFFKMKGEFYMKKLATILLVTFMVFSLTGCGNKAMQRNYREKIAERDEIILELEAEISSIKAEREELDASNRVLKNQIANCQQDASYYEETLNSLREENQKLRDELANKTTNSTPAPSQNTQTVQSVVQVYPVGTDQSQFLFSLIFYPDPDGKKYEDTTPTWYSNPYCMQGTEVTQHINLISDVVLPFKLPNINTTVYVCRTTHNTFVYSTEYPYLTEVK